MELLIASIIQGALAFFIKGGFFMIILLIVSVAAGTVIVLRGNALRERSIIPPVLAAEIESLQPGDDLDKLERLITRYPSSLGRVLSTLIQHLTWSRAEAVEAVQTKARHEVARLESGLVILEITTGIAPLLGLLGTLSGLVGIFAGIGTDPVAVARGIAEALNTTIVGLAVAVPSLITYNYFQRRIEVMAVEMESLVADLVVKCYPPGETPVVEAVSMRFYSRKRRAPSIIIVSFIDILAILLIFFIVTTTFRKNQPQLQINLPESKTAEQAPAEKDEPAVLRIKSAEQITLDEKPVTLDTLAEALKTLRAQTPSRPIAMQADREAPFGVVVRCLGRSQRRGHQEHPRLHPTRGAEMRLWLRG